MPTTHSHAHDMLTLYKVNIDIINSVLEKNGDLDAAYKTLFFGLAKMVPYLEIKAEWQLLIPSKIAFDYALQPDEFWSEKDNWGNTPAMYFAWSGCVDALSWLKDNKPELLDHKNNYQDTPYHFGAWSGSPEMLAWFDANVSSDVLHQRGDCRRHLVHLIAWSGNIDGLNWVLKNHPDWLAFTDQFPTNIAHYGAWSGNSAVLDWIKQHCGEAFLLSLARDGRTITHYAAWAGSVDVFEWIAQHYPDHLMDISQTGDTFCHQAVFSNNPEFISYLLSEHPLLMKKQWKPNNRGGLPEHHQPNFLNLIKIRNSVLLTATKEVLQGNVLPKTINILFTYVNEWLSLFHVKLLSADVEAVLNNVRLHISCFPEELQKALRQYLPWCELVRFSLLNSTITRAKFDSLLTILKALDGHVPISLIEKGQVIFQPKSRALLNASPLSPTRPALHPMVIEWDLLLQKINEENLSAKEILCLNFIINKYSNKRSSSLDLSLKSTVKKLLDSSTLRSLRPVLAINNMKELSKENNVLYLEKFKESIPGLPLKPEILETMMTQIIPAMRNIIENEEIILNSFSLNRENIYSLAEKVPLHINQVTTRQEFQEKLHRICLNFFGAAELAARLGRLVEFCEQISTGFCLDARLSGIFEWVVLLAENKEFELVICDAIHKEYLPYFQTMYSLTEDDMTLESVYEFIMTYHGDEPCKQHPKYAPDSKITGSKVEEYIDVELNYSRKPVLMGSQNGLFKPILSFEKLLQKANSYIKQHPENQPFIDSLNQNAFSRAIRQACSNGCTYLVEILLDYLKGQSIPIASYINEQSSNGKTALHWAAISSNKTQEKSLVKILLELGADPTMKDKENKSYSDYLDEKKDTIDAKIGK